MWFKKFLKELATGLIVVFIFVNIINYLRQPEPSSNMLSTGEVVLLDDSRYTFHTGKPVIIHFWASWCRVCKAEASNIEHLAKKYDLLTVAVNSGDDQELLTYMQSQRLHFKVLNDQNGSWAKRFNVEVFPTTFIYDAQGKLLFTEVGYTTTAGLLARMKIAE